MDGWSSSVDPQPGSGPTGAAAPQRRMEPMTVGDILDGMFRLLVANWRVYLIALGVIVIPFNAISGWLTAESSGGFQFWVDMVRDPMMAAPAPGTEPSSAVGAGFFVLQLVSFLVVTPITWGLATHLAAEAYAGASPTVGGVWRATLRRFWAILGLLVLLTLMFIAGMLVIGLVVGVLAAAAPPAAVIVVAILAVCAAIWVAVKVSLAVPALVVERVGAGRALGRSWSLVRGRFWRILGTWLLIIIILAVLSLVLIAGFAMLGGLTGVVGAVVAGVIGSFIVGMLTTPLMFNALTLLYFDSRIRGEAYDLDVMSQQVSAHPPSSSPPATEPPFG